MCPPGNGCGWQTRSRSDRNIAVHSAAKDAAQVPMLLYGLSAIPIPGWSHPMIKRISDFEKKGSFTHQLGNETLVLPLKLPLHFTLRILNFLETADRMNIENRRPF